MFLQTLGPLVLMIQGVHGALILELYVHPLVGAGGSGELVVKRSHATSLPLVSLVSLASLSLAPLASLVPLASSASSSTSRLRSIRSTGQHLGLIDRSDLAGRLGLNHGSVIQYLANGLKRSHSTALVLAALILEELTIQRIGGA